MGNHDEIQDVEQQHQNLEQRCHLGPFQRRAFQLSAAAKNRKGAARFMVDAHVK